MYFHFVIVRLAGGLLQTKYYTMFPYLIRKQLLDRVWDAAALDEAAEFWLRLYEAAAKARGFTLTPTHTLELRFRGFSRDHAPHLEDELRRRLAGSDLGDPDIYPHDDITLAVKCPMAKGSHAPPAGLGLHRLAGAPFDGLMVEVRFTAAGREAKFLKSGRIRSTLVLVGELHGGQLHLKGLWRAGPTGWEDKLCWHSGWIQEAKWLEALAAFLDTGAVPTDLAKRIMLDAESEKMTSRVVWLLNVPLGKPRLIPLLLRFVLFAAVLTLAGLGIGYSIGIERWALVAVSIPLLFFLLFFTWLFVRSEARLYFQGYRQFRDRYRSVYEEAASLVVAPPGLAERLDNPALRQVSGDLALEGFTHLGDVRIEPPQGEHLLRCWRAPDGVTYVSATFVFTTGREPDQFFHAWPASVAFLFTTYFPQGRVTSIHGRHLGFRRKLTGPEHRAVLFVQSDEPMELLARHQREVLAYAREFEAAPVPHERFEGYLRRQNDAQSEERMLYHDRPYTWIDHLFWYLQIPRRAYRPRSR
jgi:hypothetical protein